MLRRLSGREPLYFTGRGAKWRRATTIRPNQEVRDDLQQGEPAVVQGVGDPVGRRPR
ncbi:hypothetical protein [Nonomuraea jabiensis]|uniref:hypothetical protein n=1 Tax=Nonomuraea jabiensis TaxID=882448 RepID=UPI0036AA6074